jgi:hypothetical protein
MKKCLVGLQNPMFWSYRSVVIGWHMSFEIHVIDYTVQLSAANCI